MKKYRVFIIIAVLFLSIASYAYLKFETTIFDEKKTVWDCFKYDECLMFEFPDGRTIEKCYGVDMTWVTKCTFKKNNGPLGDMICKITCNYVSDFNNVKTHIMEIGSKSISIDGEKYTLNSQREYDALIKSICFSLNAAGLIDNVSLLENN